MTKNSCASAQKQENAPVRFHSVLRLRPLLKKEREDHVVLEHTSDTTVVLHPIPPRSELFSPSSALVLQTLSPEAIQTGHDVEFSFDTVLPPDSSQEKVYFSLGHSMVQSAMEPLKVQDPESLPIKTNLLISMGLVDSGKSYSCWGDRVVSLRKARDGLVPRIVDSLFSQSKHHVEHKKGHSFAINLTILQIDQSKSKPAESTIHDLLQPVVRKIISIPCTGGTGPSLLSPSSIQSLVPSNKVIRTVSGGSSQSGRTGSYSSLDEPVSVEQDPVSLDCLLVNGQVRVCVTVEEARLSLQTAMQNRKKLKNKKYDSHVLVQMQPLLLDRWGKHVVEGGRIAVLDMASIDHQVTSAKPRSGRIKDAISNRSDARTVVLHCLRALQNNQEAVQAFSGSRSLTQRSHSLKKVPYLQHKLTMLLQPLFSAHYTDYTHVTLFLATYTGYSDYMEKKELLQEMQALHRPSPTRGVETGVQPLLSRKKDKFKTSRREKPLVHASDADDEGSFCEKKRSRKQKKSRDILKSTEPKALLLERASSMSYSDSSVDDDDVVSLPPPVAPGYKAPSPQTQGFSPVGNIWASAPCEDAILPSLGPPPVAVMDFPGVLMPSHSANQPQLEVTTSDPTDLQQNESDHKSSLSSPEEDGCDFSTRSGSCLDGENTPQSQLSPVPESNQDSELLSSSQEKFSYMKTLNKVVNASKKKSRKVLEKMTPSPGSQPQELEQKYERRLKALESRNSDLEREIALLRERNDQLQRENDKLKRMQEQNGTLQDLDADSEDSSSLHENKSKSENMFDNPLFEHMANMNQSESGW